MKLVRYGRPGKEKPGLIDANGKIRDEGLFDRIWIQPASGDAGGALGAALAVYYLHKGRPRETNGWPYPKSDLEGPGRESRPAPTPKCPLADAAKFGRLPGLAGIGSCRGIGEYRDFRIRREAAARPVVRSRFGSTQGARPRSNAGASARHPGCPYC